MASNIIEFFGYDPNDKSSIAVNARSNNLCPFLNKKCTKTLSDGKISGACTIKPTKGNAVICCPIRLYADDYKILRDVADIAFGPSIPLIAGNQFSNRTGECITVFGKRWGKELRLPSRGGKNGAYSVDWILARINVAGDLIDFVAIEVQSIDTTSNYRAERDAYLHELPYKETSTAGLNWENVNKRILPQIIYKGHVLRQEKLCQKGLFFICPTPVYQKITERLGGGLRPYPIQPGALTVMWYDIEENKTAGQYRKLINVGQFTTTVDQVALAFTSPSNLPTPQVYENAIRTELNINL